MSVASEEIQSVPRLVWWRRWFVAPVLAQLTQGISPDRIAWSISLGIVIGVFPILGSTTVVCLLAAWALRLNHVAMQVFKEAVYPLHLLSIPIFIRMGERLAGVPLMSFSITELIKRFYADPTQFLKDFGMAAWHGVSAWLLFAPVAALALKWLITPSIRRLADTLKKRKEATA